MKQAKQEKSFFFVNVTQHAIDEINEVVETQEDTKLLETWDELRENVEDEFSWIALCVI